MKKTAIILILISICITTSISSYASPYYVPAKGKIIVDSISFRFSENDIEKYKRYDYKYDETDNYSYISVDSILMLIFDYPYIENSPKPFSYEEAVQYYQKYLLDWILGYPNIALEMEIGGTVTLDFVIERDGTISNINVSQCPFFDKYILRAVGGKWVQGRINLVKVPVSVHLQVTFEITEKGYRGGAPEYYKKEKKRIAQ